MKFISVITVEIVIFSRYFDLYNKITWATAIINLNPKTVSSQIGQNIQKGNISFHRNGLASQSWNWQMATVPLSVLMATNANSGVFDFNIIDFTLYSFFYELRF